MKRILSTVAFVMFIVVIAAVAVYALNGSAVAGVTTPEIVPGSAGVASAAVLAPGEVTATNSYNVIALPLDVESNWLNDGYTFDADGLANYIGATSVEQVLRLDAARQDWDSWFPATQDGFVGGGYTTTPFALQTGGSYWLLVDSTSPTVFSIVGDVPAQGTIDYTLVGTDPSCSNNQIMLPLDQSTIADADQLANSISANAATDVAQVLSWDATRQDFDSWFPSSQDGFVGGGYTTTPFNVQIGYPYWVCLHSGVDGNVWP